MSVAHSIHAPSPAAATLMRALIVCSLASAYLPLGGIDRASASGVDHLVVSEVMTGATSASDELIELYNPFSTPLPLEGLEVVYVTASGATVSRRASWSLGAPEIPPGGHLLIANELGIFAPIADALYASGMAATGGSVALRIQGAGSAIDAVGWGNATNAWLEGMAAAAPPAGASLERLPGGPAGSTVDTNANHTDFTTRPVPDPQNTGSPPVPDPIQPTPTPDPTGTPDPTPAPTPDPTVTPAPNQSPGPTATPGPMPISVATARALPDGTMVTVEGDTLTASDFTDGGGYLADPSGAVAVLIDAGSFARGQHLLIRGVVDDRFAQRTIRAAAGDISVTGPGIEPEPVQSMTGAVNESIEARLVRIAGTIAGSPTVLSGGLAFDVDDGSGATRVVVATPTGIDTAGWSSGAAVGVTGVVGQRDSSGTGSSGYRVQPRGPEDVELLPASPPTPSPGGSPSLAPTPSPSAAAAVVPIARARTAARNARVTVRGVVTLASGTVEAGSAVIQDGTGAILLRLGEEAGSMARGQLLEVAGVRSTKSGMESLRVSVPPRRLGTAPDPTPRALRTGGAIEAAEAQLVVVRGAIVAAARKASNGTVSFELDDGSGRLRVVIGARVGADRRRFAAGTWVEVRGVLGQQTIGAQPLRGYRVWPRTASDLRVLAGATRNATSSDSPGGIDGGGRAATGSLAAVGSADLAGLRVGATLVSSAWPELGVAGLLWDGARLVGIAPASGDRVEGVLEGRAVPLSLELAGLRELGQTARAGFALVTLGDASGDTVLGSAPPASPSARMPGRGDPPAWVSLIGRVTTDHGNPEVEIAGARVALLRLCNRGRLPEGTASLLGVATADPPRMIVGCDGSRPAPTLSLVASGHHGGTRIRPGTHAPSADPVASVVPRHRLLAAVLLASGVGILGLGVMLGRRPGPRDPNGVGEEGEAATSLAPQLTLVRLPNEHGP